MAIFVQERSYTRRSNEDDKLDPDEIFIEPPATENVLMDEDYGDEAAGGLLDNLSRRQLTALAEVRFVGGENGEDAAAGRLGKEDITWIDGYAMLNFTHFRNCFATMPFTSEQDRFIVMAHFRSGTLNPDGNWSYSLQFCIEQFMQQYPDEMIEYDIFKQHKCRLVHQFETKNCSCKGKSTGRPTVLTENVIENIQKRINRSPKKAVSQLSQQTGLSVCLVISYSFIQLLQVDVMSRGSYCISKSCFANKLDNPGVAFFNLPKDHLLAKEWIEEIGRDDLQHNNKYLTSHYQICSMHFTSEQFKKTYPRIIPKSGSVPSINTNLSPVNMTNEHCSSIPIDRNNIENCQEEISKSDHASNDNKLVGKISHASENRDQMVEMQNSITEKNYIELMNSMTYCNGSEIGNELATNYISRTPVKNRRITKQYTPKTKKKIAQIAVQLAGDSRSLETIHCLICKTIPSDMDSNDFRDFGKAMIDYVADYMDNIRDRDVLPSVTPGYLEKLVPEEAPNEGENWKTILQDVENIIMPGVTHWHSPSFHAYYPTSNSFPGIVGEILSAGIACIGFSWMSSPACTELEVVTMNWLGKLLGLPEHFLNCSEGPGGGVIQGSASEATLVGLLAAKEKSLKELKELYPTLTDGEIKGRMIAYTSDQANSSVEKAGLLASVPMIHLTTKNDSLRGATLREAIRKDRAEGKIPIYVVATLGTTGTCAFDDLVELARVCNEENIWIHVDAAYAGAAFVCPEYRHLMKGVELCDSFNFNPHKWMLVNFDCSAMWVKDVKYLVEAFNVDRIYLKHQHDGHAPDYRHWQIPLGRRFRSLKLWFVLRIYGVEGIRKHIRQQISLAKHFEQLLRVDPRFEINTSSMGLVCFRLKGDNALTKELIEKITADKKLYVIPCYIQEKFVIRFAICSRLTTIDDVNASWTHILSQAQSIVPVSTYIGNGITFDEGKHNSLGLSSPEGLKRKETNDVITEKSQ
ncbi:hypothetical protein FQA39_LY08915 [Lamprigera yunnana]|nr:hypothetical protein FQA39_LY08915 [Lamprigera yunnana]